jgi:4-aminobutyrate aminotransferase
MIRTPSKPPPSESDVNVSRRRAMWRAGRQPDALLARDKEAFLHQSVSSPCLTTVSRAEGIWLTDGQGHRVMDFHGNNVHHIGYGHPRLKAAITAQMDALPFAPRRFASEMAVELAEKLGRITPGDLSKVLLATGGSDANEMALKLARAATGRFKTLSFWDAFHGAGFGASSVGGEALFRGPAIGPLLPGAEHVAPFACYRCPYGHDGPDGCGLACAAMLDYVLEREGDVAAVIAEPMRAVPYLPPPGFWRQVREACDRHGTLLIFDEIPTGLGKTGRMFACEHDGVTPDILVLGKGLGGGILPLAAIIARPELDVAGDYALGHYTHEKNPVLARAALETIAIIEDGQLVANAADIGLHALERLRAMQEHHDIIGDVRGAGFLIGIELVRDRATRTPAMDRAEAVLYAAYDRGLSFKLTMGNVITLTPPLITSREQMDAALDIIADCLAGTP